MAVTVRSAGWGGPSANTSELLVAYINDKINALEPDLQYARLGKRRDVPKGYDRLLFPQTNQVPVKINVSGPNPTSFGSSLGANLGGSVWGAGASIQGGQTSSAAGFIVSSTEGVTAITEGTNPTAITWGATSYGSGPYQYGILFQVSDLLVRNSAIEVVDDCTMQVKNALARLVDIALQTVVNGGVNGVIYSGGKTSRTGIGAGDLLTHYEVTKAVRNLRSSNASGLKPFEGGYYVGIIHSFAMFDLMTSTGGGSWTDLARYSSVDELKTGKVGDFRGARFLDCPFQNYFNSTVPVFPTTFVGQDSFGWGYFQTPQPILVTTPDSNNPLNLYTSIGGKVTLGATRFEDTIGTQRIARIESAVSA